MHHILSKLGVFSSPSFPVFELNMGKYIPEKTPYLDTFHAVYHKRFLQTLHLVSTKCLPVVSSFQIKTIFKKFEDSLVGIVSNLLQEYVFFDDFSNKLFKFSYFVAKTSFIYLFVCLFICLFIYLFIYL